MRICVAGAAGAFGIKHLDAIANIEEATVTSIMGPNADRINALAEERGIGHASTDLAECIARNDVDAVILSTPTQLHVAQAIECMNAGKHVLIEIPMADTLAGSEELVRVQKETGLVAMVDHVRRFNPSHQWVHNRIRKGELTIQQMDVQTYFFRRTNMNAMGKPRSWTDHLLWHHACHTVDLFIHQTGETPTEVFGMQGPKHPDLGIAMDMTIGMKSPSGALCTLSLSFNNDGPLGTFFRYICDNGTYIASYDDLYNGKMEKIDLTGVAVSNNGIELADREFINAIKENREPISSIAQGLAAMKVLDAIERTMSE